MEVKSCQGSDCERLCLASGGVSVMEGMMNPPRTTGSAEELEPRRDRGDAGLEEPGEEKLLLPAIREE